MRNTAPREPSQQRTIRGCRELAATQSVPPPTVKRRWSGGLRDEDRPRPSAIFGRGAAAWTAGAGEPQAVFARCNTGSRARGGSRDIRREREHIGALEITPIAVQQLAAVRAIQHGAMVGHREC
jgi:hypothetical protein